MATLGLSTSAPLCSAFAMRIAIRSSSLLCLVLIACVGGGGSKSSKDDDPISVDIDGGGVHDGGADSQTIDAVEAPSCPPQAFWPETVGCTVTLRTPANCSTVSFPAEFAWEGVGCHTPYYLQITGNPPDEDLYNHYAIESVVNAMAWAEPVDASYLSGLYSQDGWYHWRICNAYGTGCSGTWAFRVE